MAAFRRFQQLTAELAEPNERICRLHPPATRDLEQRPPGKRNATRDPERRPNRGREPAASVIANARRKLGTCDLEALEEATGTALHMVGALLLEDLLEDTQDVGQPPLCTCGNPMRRGPGGWSAWSAR